MVPLYAIWNVTAAALGACLGSFLSVCVLRIPEGESIVSPPSHCPICEARVAWYDNVPMLSWLALRGRCRSCGAPISPLYPMLEGTMTLVGWLVWRRFVPTPHDLDAAHLSAFFTYLLFAWALLCATYTDLRARIVPEIASQWMVPIILVGTGITDLLGYDGWLSIGWRASVIGAFGGGGFVFLLAELWARVFGHEGLGRGDVWLMALIGAAVGLVPGAWAVLLLASFLGAILGVLATLVRGPGGFAFAPWLSIAALLYMLWGDTLVARFLPTLAPFVH